MDNKKRIALITTWFPPKNGVAVNRMHAFAKYLSTDYEIEVFTEGKETESIKNESFTTHYIKSDSFLNNIKHQTDDSWYRHNLISLINVTKGFLGYSTLKKWVKGTVSELSKQHLKQPFDLLISSYAPFEAHQVAIELVKKYNLPWIADMRDEMSKNPFVSKGERQQLIKKEDLICRHAAAITSVSYPIVDDFKLLMPDIKYFEEVRNGFDHELIFGATVKNKTFTIGYFGNFYGERKPDTFFKALVQLFKKSSIQLQIKIVGAHKTFHIPNSISQLVEILPPVNYIEAVKLMQQMDANLLVHPSGMHKGVYTGKLFDYISVQKPVIGVIDKEDVAAELIEKYKCGYVADFYDCKEIEEMLLKAYQDWGNDIVLKASQEQLQQLHRKNEVKKLANLIKQLTAV